MTKLLILADLTVGVSFFVVLIIGIIVVLVIVLIVRFSKKKKKKRKNEFRYSSVKRNSRPHPHWIYESYDLNGQKMYKSVNITHRKPRGKAPSMKLNKNPKIGSNEIVYVSLKPYDRPIESYSKDTIKKMKMSKKDSKAIRKRVK